jgi:glycosyltransferase involved in cell wall biosynthesis
VHEAAAAGLLILASEQVGASPHLVQYNYNGYVFEAENANELANHMARISSMAPAKLNAMASASFSLSQQFTPAQWADSLMRYVQQRRPHTNHSSDQLNGRIRRNE